ncbi:septum formation initiator family protein [Schaalia canis]|uniref:Septum formation initiator family protein n=2 Tax=Schaalia canis TaxID=100469 RepID=A0A3P1SER0_9ACTO|nr:septum formation initiator family protein [Schaalia canis]
MEQTPRPKRPHSPRRRGVPASPHATSARRSRRGSTQARPSGTPENPSEALAREQAPEASAVTSSSERRSTSKTSRAAASSLTHPSPTRNTRSKERRRHRNTSRTAAVTQPAHSFNIGGVEISLKFMFVVIIGALLAVMLMPSLYQWWRQEQDYRDIQARVEAARERNAELERELELWNTPEFIASQARERLGYVMPGETQYSVVDPGPGYQDQAAVAAAAPRGPARPWVHMFALLTSEADAPAENEPTTP